MTAGMLEQTSPHSRQANSSRLLFISCCIVAIKRFITVIKSTVEEASTRFGSYTNLTATYRKTDDSQVYWMTKHRCLFMTHLYRVYGWHLLENNVRSYQLNQACTVCKQALVESRKSVVEPYSSETNKAKLPYAHHNVNYYFFLHFIILSTCDYSISTDSRNELNNEVNLKSFH